MFPRFSIVIEEQERIMDQLVLSDLSHKVLQEEIAAVTDINPVISELMEFIMLLVTDDMSRPNL